MARRIIMLCALSLALAGCTNQIAEPIIEVREIRVPVSTPCISVSEIAEAPAQVGDMLTGIASHDAPILAASALELRRWGEWMRGLLVSCAVPITGPP